MTTAASGSPRSSKTGAELTRSTPKLPSPRRKATSSASITSPVATVRASGHSSPASGRPSGWKPSYSAYSASVSAARKGWRQMRATSALPSTSRPLGISATTTPTGS